MPVRSHTTRLAAALGVFGLAAALTGAAVFVNEDVSVHFNGTDNRFAIVAAAAEGHTWTPTAAEWHAGSADPIILDLGDADSGPRVITPDDPIEVSIAVKNDGPLDGLLSLHIDDVGVAAGTQNLFGSLQFTVTEGSDTLLDRQTAGTTPLSYSWPASVPEGASKVLRVRISLPATATDNTGSAAGIRFRFEGVNA
ncbi:hypothetical protein [Leifsonia poae]|uniref:DUF11 domain-containing protein n=1 Tax=Leifsonia poae TaxID=110933 RepID=A0A9W6LYJ6_9MICO|nr:hypothetical protein [Leifsonia poae]GLJ74910.1 hypothetical protein GCM10017584_04830 [Leifsonia poae]